MNQKHTYVKLLLKMDKKSTYMEDKKASPPTPQFVKSLSIFELNFSRKKGKNCQNNSVFRRGCDGPTTHISAVRISSLRHYIYPQPSHILS